MSKTLKSNTFRVIVTFCLQKRCSSGNQQKKELERANSTLAAKLRFTAKSAFLKCAEYLQKKLPINNPILQAIKCLDPTRNRFLCTETKLILKNLPDLVKNIFLEKVDEDEDAAPENDGHDYNEEENADAVPQNQDYILREEYQKQVLDFCNCQNLPMTESVTGTLVPIDEWWSSLPNEFHLLKKMVSSLLTCFHGPRVESTFSFMNNVLDSRSSRMAVSTLSAIQTVKYALAANKKTAIEYFSRKEKLYTPINRALCRNMRTSYDKHMKEQEKERIHKEEQRNVLSLKKQKAISKRKAKAKIAEAEKAARNAHIIAQRDRRKSMLQALVSFFKSIMFCFYTRYGPNFTI